MQGDCFCSLAVCHSPPALLWVSIWMEGNETIVSDGQESSLSASSELSAVQNREEAFEASPRRQSP